MSVRSASGSIFGGALRQPQFIVAAFVAATIAVVATVYVSTNGTDPKPVTTSDAATFTSGTLLPAGPASAPISSTVYLVSSPDMASQLSVAIADGDSIRGLKGLPPSGDSVLLVTSEEEAASMEAAISDANAILWTIGEPPVNVIKMLSTSSAGTSTTTVPERTEADVIAEHEQYINGVLGGR